MSDGTQIEIERFNGTMMFRDVDASCITDRLTVKVLAVNGQDAEAATQNGYGRIVSTNLSLSRVR